MISIERLFTLTAQKAISLEPINGRGVFSAEDAAGVIAQAMKTCPVGVRILEARIAGNKGASLELREIVKEKLIGEGRESSEAAALARLVVHEVCGTKVCPKCNGNGFNITNFTKGTRVDCHGCNGVGQIILSCDDLAYMMGRILNWRMTKGRREQFVSEYYDQYSQVVDWMYRAAGDADSECKRILRLVAEQQGWAA